MQQNVDVFRINVVHEVFTAYLLTPGVAETSLESVGEPKRVVKLAFGAHRDSVGIQVSVHSDAIRGSLKEALVLDGPSDNLDVDGGVRESVESI